MGKAKLGITRDYFDDAGNLTIPGPGLALLDDLPDFDWLMFPEFHKEISATQIQGCDMVLSGLAHWTKQSVAGNDQLIAVLYTGVGYDHLDVGALSAEGVMLCLAPDAVRRPMACVIITYILVLANRLLEKDHLTRQGRWGETELQSEGITGKTLGSIGVGNIGREVFVLAQPFGMRHLACDPYVKQQDIEGLGVELIDMETLLAESDFVSLSVPLNKETHHLIGEHELQQMKSTTYLISTSRGSVVDEPALTRALQEGWIRGAGLDVFEQEPVDPNNPILKMDNVVVSPHSLCHTDEYYMGAWSDKLSQAAKILRGEIPHSIVNKEVLETPGFKTKFAKFQST